MRTFLTAIVLGAIVNLLPAQQIITGSVYFHEEGPICGASVYVEGTTMGTITDTLGNFTISVETDTAVLRFKFVASVPKTVVFVNGIAQGNREGNLVSLKPDVIRCYFDLRQIDVSVNYGWLMPSYGGGVEFRPIGIGLGTVSFGGQIRISANESRFEKYAIGLRHLAQGYETVWDFEVSHLRIKQMGQSEIYNTGLVAYAQNSGFFRSWMKWKLGVGYATRFDLEDNTETWNAFSLDAGVRVLLGRTRLELETGMSVLPGLIGRYVTLEREFRRVRLGVEYEKYGDWEELSTGVTYSFGY